MKIPESLVERMEEQGDYVVRQDVELARREMNALGVNAQSEAYCFFSKYVPAAAVYDAHCYEELVDPCSPTPQMREVTEFVRETYGVGERFICLTSAEGEGFYLLDVVRGGVYDVDVPVSRELNEGDVEPTWPSFFAFMDWILPEKKG